jgi:transposase-like protein
MQERTDWGEIRQAVEAGASVAEAARRFGVARSAINVRRAREDWGGCATRNRRDKVVRMLLRAGEKLAGADDMEAVERQARRLTALGAMAKALRAFDPRLAAADAREEEDGDSEAAVAAFSAQIEQVIEARVAERLAKRQTAEAPEG